MNKKSLITSIVLLVLAVFFNYAIKNIGIKKYSINTKGEEIKVQGTLFKDNIYRFSTIINLGNEPPLSSAILEINLFTQVEFDSKSNKYILENPKLEINSIGCEQYEKNEERINDSEITCGYAFGVKSNQMFSQDMSVSSAKVLLDSKNVEVVRIVDSYDTNIFNINTLNRTNKLNEKIKLEYKTLDQYFACFFHIKFDLTSDKEGKFYVF